MGDAPRLTENQFEMLSSLVTSISITTLIRLEDLDDRDPFKGRMYLRSYYYVRLMLKIIEDVSYVTEKEIEEESQKLGGWARIRALLQHSIANLSGLFGLSRGRDGDDDAVDGAMEELDKATDWQFHITAEAPIDIENVNRTNKRHGMNLEQRNVVRFTKVFLNETFQDTGKRRKARERKEEIEENFTYKDQYGNTIRQPMPHRIEELSKYLRYLEKRLYRVISINYDQRFGDTIESGMEDEVEREFSSHEDTEDRIRAAINDFESMLDHISEYERQLGSIPFRLDHVPYFKFLLKLFRAPESRPFDPCLSGLILFKGVWDPELELEIEGNDEENEQAGP